MGTPITPPTTNGKSRRQSKPPRRPATDTNCPTNEPPTASGPASSGTSVQDQIAMAVSAKPKPDSPWTNPASTAPARMAVVASIQLIRPQLLHPGYFTDENAVGVRNWLLMLATIGPSFSLSARAVNHSLSVWNANHFVSRSAIDSQESR